MPDDLGLRPVEPISESERVELEFLRYEAGHLQRRLREVEESLAIAEIERDTIRHERNLMAQDFVWTLRRLNDSPVGPVLRKTDGFRRLLEQWGDSPE